MIVPRGEVSTGSPSPGAFYPEHYWAGAYYTGSSNTARMLQVTVQVPADVPDGGNDDPGTAGGVWYVVLLSAFDSNDSYDQIGFGAAGGTWSVAYSTSTSCDEYRGQDSTYELTPGETYVFRMDLAAGVVAFAVIPQGNSTPVFTADVYTGGTEFLVESFDSSCSDDYDYTDYEEVMDTIGPFVPYDLFFTLNQVFPDDGFTNGNVSTWGIMDSSSGPPSGVDVYLNGAGAGGCNNDYNCNITIANEPYYLEFPPGVDPMTLEPSNFPSTYTTYLNVLDLSPDSPIYVDRFSEPSGWNATLTPQGGSPPFSVDLAFSVPASTAPGLYYVGLNATDTSGTGSFAHISLAVRLLPELTGSIGLSPSSGELDVGQTIQLSASVAGGTGNYSYDWSDVPTSCTAENASTWSCPGTSPGQDTVLAVVVDSLRYAVTLYASWNVYGDPNLTLVPQDSSIVDGQALQIGATVSGGTSPFSYSWVAAPPGCSGHAGQTLSCTPTEPGSYELEAKVTDSSGLSSTAYGHVTVVVNATAGSSSPQGVPVLVAASAVAILVVALAAIAVWLGRRSRRRPGQRSE